MRFPLLMTPPADGWTPKSLAIIMAVYVGIILLVLAPGYILNGLSLSRIAKRRAIARPWLAWVPIGSAWLLGRISDHYQLLVRQKKTRRSTILLLLRLGCVVGYILVLTFTFIWLDYTARHSDSHNALWPVVAAMPALTAVFIATAVFTLVAKHDLFRSCDPKNATAYLIVSIAVQFVIKGAEIVAPILMLICSKKDEGMPKPQPEEPYEDI